MERRSFLKICAAAAAAAASAPPVAADARPQLYGRVKLVGADSRPLRAAAIPANRNLIFHYPYATTPCFLLNLGRPAAASVALKTVDDQPYEWRGGVGARRSIVAYSAICAHKLTYPTRDISFISYRAEKTTGNKFANVIHCCSEHSQYDPAQGGRVLAGDELTAVGTLGGEMFEQFFDKYAFRLALEAGGEARRPMQGSAPVTLLENYCRQQVKC
jgi:Rieske Fe-S protein